MTVDEHLAIMRANDAAQKMCKAMDKYTDAMRQAGKLLRDELFECRRAAELVTCATTELDTAVHQRNTMILRASKAGHSQAAIAAAALISQQRVAQVLLENK